MRERMDLKIEYLPVKELKPYERNARKHQNEDVTAIVASIRDFGFDDPIGIWSDKNIIVEGHGRLLAAKKLGMKEVPCIRLDHLSDEQRRAYALAHNRTAELSVWNDELLNLELGDITDIDMEELGFNLEDPLAEAEAVDDDYDIELPEEPRAKRGDIWQLGRHRLICGDSTDPAFIDRLMDGVKADMVFTDPPYGMSLDTDFSSMQNHLDFAKEITGGKKYDQGKVDEFHPEMIDAVFTIDADEMFLWGADYFAELLPNKNDGSWIVWDKRANGNDDVAEDYSSDKMYGSCFELCWSKKKHKRDIARVKWAGVFGTDQEFDHKRYHPTQKPIKLAGWFLDRYSKEGQVIIDLFGGSGSTLIACEQLNRKCYMCELDPKYVDVIVDRWEKFTGERAVLLNGEERQTES